MALPPWARHGRFISGLLGVLVAFQLLVVAINLSPLLEKRSVAQLFHVNLEATIVAWFSSTMLWTIALLCFYAGWVARRRGQPRLAWAGWVVIGLGFMLLSLDEAVDIHNLLGRKAAQYITVSGFEGGFLWVLVVAPVALLGALWMLVWISRHVGFGSATFRLSLAAVAVWVVVPVLEAFAPALDHRLWLLIVEETLETAGSTLFLVGMLLYLRDEGLLAALAPPAGS